MNKLDRLIAEYKAKGYTVALCDKTATGGTRVALLNAAKNELATLVRSKAGIKVTVN